MPSCDDAPITHRCPECGAPVACGSAANLPHCWCSELPHVMPLEDCTARCLCRTCLEAKIADRLSDRPGTSPDRRRP